jgi:hypothetical protein
MDINSIKQRLNSLQSTNSTKKEKIDYSKVLWKPKEEGKYQVRIVPSKLDKNYPFKEVFVHYGLGKFPIFALTNWGEKDPIIEFASKLRSTNDKENWILAKKIDPKMRIFAPVVVRGEEDKGTRLWEFGKEIYMQLLGIAEDEDYGDFTDINEGRDFTVEAVYGDVGGRKGLKTSIRIKPKQTPLSVDKNEIKRFLAEQPDILEIQRKPDYEYLKTILQNWLSPEEESEESDEIEEKEIESTPTLTKNFSVKTPQTKVNKVSQFDDLFSDDDEGEDEDEVINPFETDED